MKTTFAMLLAGPALIVCSCGPTSPTAKEVVVYVSVDDVYSRPIAERFAQRTGIEVKLLPDSEETKSSGLVNRLIAEAPRPRADVFWSGDPIRAAILKERGLSEPYRSPQAGGLPPQFSDKDGFFTGFAARLRVIVYNRTLVKEDALPESVFDLLQPRFASKACMANPLFGTTSMQAAALFEQLGEAKGTNFFRELTRNGVTMLSSNGEVRRRVAAGDFQIGLTDSDDASVAIKEGQSLGFIIPDQKAQGTVLIPCAAVLIKGAPNPENAKKFIDFVVSEEVEQLLAQSDASHLPLRASVTPPALFSQGVAGIRAMVVDYDRLAKALETLNSGFLLDWATREQKAN